MTAPSVREALERIRARSIADDDADEKELRRQLYHIEALARDAMAALATPPAPTPSAARERIARIIDPSAFENWQGQYDYCLKTNSAESDARRCADYFHKADCDEALVKADAILALLPNEAAIYICYDGYGQYFISRERPASHVAIVYDEGAAEKVVDLFNNDTPDAAAIRAAAFEEAAKIAHNLFLEQPAKNNHVLAKMQAGFEIASAIGGGDFEQHVRSPFKPDNGRTMTEIVERLRAGYAGDAPFPFDRAPMALTVEPVYLVRDHDMREIAASLAAKDKEIERLRRYLHPYADDTEISGMSWSGFHLIGNKKSIAELHRIENRSSQLDVFRAAFDERVKAAESRAEQAERALAEAADKTKDEICEALLVISDGWTQQSNTETATAVSNAAVFTCGLERTKRISRAFVAQHGSDSREGK